MPIGDPVRRGDQGRACDDESKRDHPSGDRHRPGPDRITEDQDAADDRDQVGRYRGERDDLDARADLQATGRGIEGDTEAASAANVHGLISSSTPP